MSPQTNGTEVEQIETNSNLQMVIIATTHESRRRRHAKDYKNNNFPGDIVKGGLSPLHWSRGLKLRFHDKVPFVGEVTFQMKYQNTRTFCHFTLIITIAIVESLFQFSCYYNLTLAV